MNPQTLPSYKQNINFSQLECSQEDIGAHGENKLLSCSKQISMSIDHHRQDRIQRTTEKPHKCEKCGRSFSSLVTFKITSGYMKEMVTSKSNKCTTRHTQKTGHTNVSIVIRVLIAMMPTKASTDTYWKEIIPMYILQKDFYHESSKYISG